VKRCLTTLSPELEGVALSVCSVESLLRLRGFRLMRTIEMKDRKEKALTGEKQ
jgi:hypothetical protein